jgi:uncharacterized membrane protein
LPSPGPIELGPDLQNTAHAKLSSFTVLLLHEIESFNRMVATMREGLDSCHRAMLGTHVMSEYVESLVHCISSDTLMDEIKVGVSSVLARKTIFRWSYYCKRKGDNVGFI